MRGRLSSKFARDECGHVPFAVISVILLVTSLTFVGYLETRQDPRVENDVDLAMDRTDAAIQTAVREAATRGAERAARQPLTSAANTTYGTVLASDDTFEAYLRARIYLEVRESLQTAGQSVGSVDTTVSVPSIDDAASFEAAIDRVTLSNTGDRGDREATLTVEISNVTTAAIRDGTEVERLEQSVSVTIATPVVQLHERTERFQEKLNAGVTERGLSQRFNARIYALGWARGYAQYGGMPVTDVVANRHIKPSVNDGVYRTQKDVFGAADPRLNNAVRRGWLCMAMQDAQELYDEYRTDLSGRDLADTLCEASEWVLGNRATGELPNAPGTSELLGEAPGMEAEHTIDVDKTAHLPLHDMVTSGNDHSIGRVIDRIYTFETGIDTRYEIGNLDLGVNCEYGSDGSSRSNEGVDVLTTSVRERDDAEQYYEYRGKVRVDIELERECWISPERNDTTTKSDRDSFVVDIETTIREDEASPDARIDEINPRLGIDYRYDRGPPANGTGGNPAPVPVEPQFRNYQGVGEKITMEILGGTSASTFGTWVEGHLSGTTRTSDVELPDTKTVTVDHDEFLDRSLESTILRDISSIQDDVAGVTHTFERRELVDQGGGEDTGPYGELAREINDVKMDYLERDTTYVNVAGKAVYEARVSYFELLEAELLRIERAHTRAMGSIDDELETVDGGLEDGLAHLQQGITAEEPDPIPIDSGDLTNNLSYEISGSPTYLVAENVTSTEVPQVTENTTFAPLAVRNENHLRVPYEAIADGVLGKLFDIIGGGSPDTEVSFRVAGDALRAGILLGNAEERNNVSYANETAVATLTDGLEDAIDEEIETFGSRVAETIAVSLYPDDVQTSCRTLECLEHPHTQEIPRDCGGNLSCDIVSGTRADNATSLLETSVLDTLETYDTTAKRAIAIGNGNATEKIVDSVVETLAADEYRATYAEGFGSEEWNATVDSAVRPAVVTAAGERTVTLDGSELVEQLDERTRGSLANVSENVVADRIDAFPDEQFTVENSEYEDWIGGTDTPLRVPAGVPLLPVPGYWFATMNVWSVEAQGTYARFEVTANMGTPDTTTATSYVRENQSVELDIAGERRSIGSVRPIEFSTRSILVVVVPPGGIGVGDRGIEDVECSSTWPRTGTIESAGECTGGTQ